MAKNDEQKANNINSTNLSGEAEYKIKISSEETEELKKKPVDELIEKLQIHQVELQMQNEELQKNQRLLEDSRDKYIDLYDFAPVGYFVFDHLSIIKEVNLTGARFLGIERNKMLNHTFRQFVYPDNHEIWDRHILNVLKHDEKQTCDLMLVNKDGRSIYVRLDSIQLHTKDGKTKIRTAMSDITDRKQAEHQVRERKKELQAFYSLSELMEREDLTLEKLYEEFINILPNSWQYPEITYCRIVINDVNFSTKNFKESVWRQSSSLKVHRSLVGTVEIGYIEEKPEEYEGPFLKEERLLLDSVAERLGHIIERKQAQELLRESEEKYRTLFETISIGIVLYSFDGKIISANRAAERILGLTLNQMQNRTLIDSKLQAVAEDGSDFPNDDHPSKVALRTGKEVHDVIMGVLNPKTNGYTWVNINAIPLFRYMEDKPFRSYTTFEDITKRKQAENAVRRREVLLYSAGSIGQLLLSASDISLALDNTIQLIGEASGQDYSYLFKMHPDPKTSEPKVSLQCEWIQEHIKPLNKSDLQNISFIQTAPYFYERLKNGFNIHGRPQDFPSQEREAMEAQGINNIMLVPVKVRGCFWGFIGFNNYQTDYELSIGEEAVYTTVASSIGGFIERIESENSMRDSKKLISQLLQTTDQGIYGIDMEGKCTFINKSGLNALGYRTEECVGKNMHDLIHHSYSDGSPYPVEECPVFRAKFTGKGARVESEVLWRKNGTSFPAEYSSHPIIENGEIRGAVITFIDIADRKKAEDELRNSEERFRAIFENNSTAIAIIDLDSTISMVNDEYCKISGYTKEDVIGKSWTQQIPPGDLERLKEYNRRRILNPQDAPEKYEFTFYSRSGEIKHALMSVTMIQRNEKIIASFLDITERKRTEMELRNKEVRLQNVIDGTNTGTWEWDIQTGETIFNDRWAAIVGYTLEELQPTNIDLWTKLAHPDDLKISDELLQKHFRGETEYYSFDSRMKHKNGSWVWVLDCGRVIEWNKEGKPIRMFGTHIDITQRKQAEKALEDVSTRWQTTFDAIDDFIILLKPDHEIIEVNKAVLKTFNKKREEVIGKKCFTIFHNTDSPIKYCPCEISLKEKRVVVTEYVDGDRTYELTAWPVFDENNNVQAFTHIVKNITERKHAEESLRESRERLKVIVESNPIAIWDWDIELDTWSVTPKYFSMLGYEPENGMLDRNIWLNRVHPDDKELVAEKIKNVLTHKTDNYEYEVKMLHADGSYRWHSVIGNVIKRDKSNNATRMVGVRIDINERKLAEDDLRESNRKLQETLIKLNETQKQVLQQERLRALGQLASGIAHDINNSLSPILGYSDILLGNEELMKLAPKPLTVIRTASLDIKRTIERMKEFYRPRIESLEYGSISLNKIIKSTIDLTKHRWKDISESEGIVITIKTKFQNDLPIINGNESEIREALTNIILNAADAMSKGGEISFRSFAEANNIVIEIQDTGDGMDEETRQRCFDPFYTTKGEKGTGLGLSMVFGIMERHNGVIEIDSESGKGTTIRLVFPLTKDQLNKIENRSGKHTPMPKLKILYIDDDADLRDLIYAMLQKDLHNVILSEGGKEGVQSFFEESEKGDPFNLVITDLGMPHLDGKSVARMIKYKSPDTPIILLTGWGAFIEENSIKNVDAILKKPILFKELNDTIMRLLQLNKKN